MHQPAPADFSAKTARPADKGQWMRGSWLLVFSRFFFKHQTSLPRFGLNPAGPVRWTLQILGNLAMVLPVKFQLVGRGSH